MIINEITRPQRRHLTTTEWTMPNQIIDWLDANGFVKTKHGSFSRVYVSNIRARIIVKVSMSQDQCWVRYAEYCQQHRDNPHLLRIKSLKTYAYQNQQYFIAIVERLKPISWDLYSDVSNALDWGSDTTHPKLQLAWDAITAIPGCRDDLHQGNVMLRGKVPVFVDPIYNAEDLVAARVSARERGEEPEYDDSGAHYGWEAEPDEPSTNPRTMTPNSYFS